LEKELVPFAKEKDLDSIVDLDTTPLSYEGCIVRFSDKIAYLGRDWEDAITLGCVTKEETPKEIMSILGDENGKFDNATIINNLVLDIIENSFEGNSIKFSDKMFGMLEGLSDFNYEKIYKHKKIAEYKIFVDNIIAHLYEYLFSLYSKFGDDCDSYANLGEFGRSFGSIFHHYDMKKTSPEVLLVDYISGMTDNFALKCMEEISIPKPLYFN
jgi:dGTPase